MSLGGRDEPSLGVIVYGPDGRAYGSPAEARNAGVSNPTMSPPADVPISYPGRQPYTPAPMPSIPTQSYGGRNRYAEIMSQFGQSQPFSFFGMPSGGFNPYAPNYTGGFTPYQRPIPAPALPVEGTTSANAGGGGGGGGADREAPSAWSQMTPAERAAYYAANPIQGSIALGFQDLFGNATLLGNAAKYFGADGWYDSRLEKMGVNPTISLDTQGILAGTSMQNALNALNPSGGTTSDGLGSPTLSGGFVQAPGEAGRGGFAPAPSTDSGVTYSTGTGDFSSQYGPDQYGPGISAGESLNQQMAQDRADAAGSGSRDAGGERGYSGDNSGDNAGWGSRDAGGDGYAKGGHVSMQRLQGPNPEGPDDGYAALKDGEFVINDKAVKKYGIELMQAINSGKISKGKLRGLLEM